MNIASVRPRPLRLARSLAIAFLALAPLWCVAQPTAAAAANYLRVANRAMGSTQSLVLAVNKSILVDFPTNVGEVIASAPSVATVVMRSKTRAIVQGVSGGDTNIFFLDGAGNNIAVLDVRVTESESIIGPTLEDAISRNIPGANIRVEAVGEAGGTRIVLTGTALSQDDANRALLMAAQFAGSPENVANLIEVSGNQQVKLKVTVAEVNRSTIKQLGINLDGSITVGAVGLGFSSTQPMGGVSGVSTDSGVSASVSTGPVTLDAQLRALEQRGAMRTLATPTLTAMSGQPAEFKAGGEFPYTTVVDGTTTTAFKEYGVFLDFTPVVKSNGRIQLLVNTKVDEPTSGGGVTNRSASTTVEIPAGQTLAIAGMLQDSVRQQINALPGLGNIPILGALFRSRDFIHSQTELVILVTPYMAYPGPEPTKPTDNMRVAGDAEAIFLGHMEKMYGVGSDGMRGSYSGSVGFVLD